jgi:hypothetical protein
MVYAAITANRTPGKEYMEELGASARDLLHVAQECDPKAQEWLTKLHNPTQEEPMTQ